MTETFFTIISLISFDAEGVIAEQALNRYGNFSSIEKCNLALEKRFEEHSFPYKQTKDETNLIDQFNVLETNKEALSALELKFENECKNNAQLVKITKIAIDNSDNSDN